MGEAALLRSTKIVPMWGSLSHGLTKGNQCFLFLFYSMGRERLGHYDKYTMNCRGPRKNLKECLSMFGGNLRLKDNQN